MTPQIPWAAPFRSRAEDLELVSEDEYKKSEHAAKANPSDAHAEMLARLQYEAEERER